MNVRPSFETFKKQAFKDPAFVAEYEALRPEFALLEQCIKARKKKSCSLGESGGQRPPRKN